MSARDDILTKIRAVTRTTGDGDRLQRRLREHPRGPLPAMDWELLARFRERCEVLSSSIDQVAAMSEVPAAVADYLRKNALPMDGVCWPELASLDFAAHGVRLEARAATGDDAVGVTGSYCAIAESGTLVLLSGQHSALKNSLLPETHIAVLPAARILRCMEDAFDLLRREHGELPRQVAFVSGPSRTADIELTLVLGIHGPYRVHIIVVNQ